MRNLLIVCIGLLLFACTNKTIVQKPNPPTGSTPPKESKASTIRAMAIPKNNAKMIDGIRWESLLNYTKQDYEIKVHYNPGQIKIDVAGFNNNQLFTNQIQEDSTLEFSIILNKGNYNFAGYFCQGFGYNFRKVNATELNILFYQKINDTYKQFSQSQPIKFTEKDILRPFWWSGSGLTVFEDNTQLNIIIKVSEAMEYQVAHLCALEIIPENQPSFYFRHTKINYDKDGNILGLSINKDG